MGKRKKKIQVRTPGTGWATYSEEEGLSVVEAFQDLGWEVEVREVPDPATNHPTTEDAVMATKKQILQRIQQAKRRIAAERDKLRDLLGELDQIADDCDEAADDLERAADAMSRLL